jgi:hypothetical protein
MRSVTPSDEIVTAAMTAVNDLQKHARTGSCGPDTAIDTAQRGALPAPRA